MAGAVSGSGVAHGSVGPEGAHVCRPSQASFILSNLPGAEPVLRGRPGTPEAECPGAGTFSMNSGSQEGRPARARDSAVLTRALSCTGDIPPLAPAPWGPLHPALEPGPATVRLGPLSQHAPPREGLGHLPPALPPDPAAPTCPPLEGPHPTCHLGSAPGVIWPLPPQP